MACKPGWTSAALAAVMCAGLVAGCQSYAFEELPSSVIKEKRWTQTIAISSAADILFVVDNSGSMVGEQTQLAQSFQAFASKLNANFGDQYRIAVITTGMESPGCPPCTDTILGSCMNETGENGRFQDRLGHNQGTIDAPDFVFTTDNTCRVITHANSDTCFYDSGTDSGTVLVGVNGCGYERGLAAIRKALSGDLLGSWNGGFLRDNATLAVVVVSDEEDCGEVGDVSESVNGAMGNICYFASKGIDGDGNSSHENDPNNKPYSLTPVEDYHKFLLDVKGGREGMVKFASIVGIRDVDNLSTTTIEYEWDAGRNMWGIVDACTTPGCTGNYCFAEPGTRYVKLAQQFGIGQNGFVDTICQNDFSTTMDKLGTFVACPKTFLLSESIRDPDLASILINGEQVPRYSCSITSRLEECSGPSASCSEGSCVETWSYTPPSNPPDPAAPGGTITFAPHYDPCELFGEGEQVHIELVYVTE